MLPKGILFDMDDTIISFDGVAERTWTDVCRDFCARYRLLTMEAIYPAIAETRQWFWSDPERHKAGRHDMNRARREIVARAFEKLGITDLAYAFEVADNFSRLRLERLELFPGAVETLEKLRELGVKLALLTNGDAQTQRNKINRFDLEKYFTCIFIEGELGYGKPDRRVYEGAMAALELSPGDLWMVGDNLEWDVWAPKELGIYGIWLDWRQGGLRQPCRMLPDRILSNISEILP